MEQNFQLAGNKTHFTVLHAANRISPIAAANGDTTSRMQRLIIQKICAQYRAANDTRLSVCFWQCK